jgi:tetratricopeptide (TPR) repeat protein
MRLSRHAQFSLAVSCLTGWLAAAADAEPISSELADAFTRGDFLQAASAAETQPDPDLLGFAARSLLAACMTGDAPPQLSLVERAARNAEQALRLDPRHEEARLQLAIALSLKGRDMPLVDAWRARLGERAASLAKAVLRDHPRNHYAHGLLAVWNIEVRRRGGALGASVMGASVEKGREHYRIAAELAPDDVGLHWSYARALAALNVGDHRTEIKAALAAAAQAGAQDHVERVMQERAAALSEALAHDPEAAQALAGELL